MKITTRVFETEQRLHEEAAERVVHLCACAIVEHAGFYLSLSGGNTPSGLYAQLARPGYADRPAWNMVHVYFGDERCVPPDHRDSNYRMASERLLQRVPIPATQIHRILGERSAEEAAAAYAQTLTETVPHENGLPCFDLVLLGVGLDGHVASLFPGTGILRERTKPAAAVYVERLDAWRVSLTLPVINNARHVIVLASGAKKAEVVRRALRDAPGADPLPVQMIHPEGELEWYLDAAAASQLGVRAEP